MWAYSKHLPAKDKGLSDPVVVTEDPAYNTGTVSLYLGISIAMLFEVLELVVDIVMFFFNATKPWQSKH